MAPPTVDRESGEHSAWARRWRASLVLNGMIVDVMSKDVPSDLAALRDETRALEGILKMHRRKTCFFAKYEKIVEKANLRELEDLIEIFTEVSWVPDRISEYAHRLLEEKLEKVEEIDKLTSRLTELEIDDKKKGEEISELTLELTELQLDDKKKGEKISELTSELTELQHEKDEEIERLTSELTGLRYEKDEEIRKVKSDCEKLAQEHSRDTLQIRVQTDAARRLKEKFGFAKDQVARAQSEEIKRLEQEHSDEMEELGSAHSATVSQLQDQIAAAMAAQLRRANFHRFFNRWHALARRRQRMVESQMLEGILSKTEQMGRATEEVTSYLVNNWQPRPRTG